MSAGQLGKSPLLAPFTLDALESDPCSTCAVDGRLRIVYVNPAWRAFALGNGGRGDELGTDLRRVVPSPLTPFYDRFFGEVLASRTPTQHTYECSSPTNLRRFRMLAFPCDAGGLVLMHALVLVRKHPHEALPPIESTYRDPDGVITQCCHCRRVRHGRSDRWDWVPEYVAHIPEKTSHGLCAPCASYHYPGLM